MSSEPNERTHPGNYEIVVDDEHWGTLPEVRILEHIQSVIRELNVTEFIDITIRRSGLTADDLKNAPMHPLA